ncbi:MAG: hypothetical protein M1831_003017 [Alyxoria varia]|nr:MAG: hypothetical protein M1831_003017 [Alyxoria varia]
MISNGENPPLSEALPDHHLGPHGNPAVSKSDHLAPENALASSPLLKGSGDSPQQLHADESRASKVSSFRLSKDLDEFRWDRPPLRDEENIIPEDDEDDVMGASSDDGAHDSARPSTEEESEEGQSPTLSKETLEAANYSTLSKRADFILANAKRRLNLLEGNLGRARNSLMSNTPAPEVRAASSLSSYAISGSLDDDEKSVRVSPRINFVPSREARAALSRSRTTTATTSGHSRMFSDTAVPSSPGGMSMKGSKSLEHMRNGEKISQSPLRPATQPADHLDAVPENDGQERNASLLQRRESDNESPPPKSTTALRAQAEELRNRIAFLQKKSEEEQTQKETFFDSPGLDQEEDAFQSQVRALEKSLRDQEAVIAQLESAENSTDPRGEWQDVFEYNENRDSGSDLSEEEDEEDSDDEGFFLGEEEEEVPEEEGGQSMAGAHEDRVDAFDYENFILHSAMGRYRASAIARSASVSSAGTASTPRVQEPEEVLGPDGAPERQPSEDFDEATQKWKQWKEPNASTVSLATTTQSFETAAEANDSPSDSEGYDSDTRNDKFLGYDPWPMPPAGSSHRSSQSQPVNRISLTRSASQETDMPTPTASHFPRGSEDKGIQPERTMRPSSIIYETLTSPEFSDGRRPHGGNLEEADEALVRSTVESLRSVCLGLDESMSSELSAADIKGLRERLEVARRVLQGEL